MTNIFEKTNWADAIYQIARTDRVEGGASGTANKQAQQLADRTQYLKAMIESFNDAAEYTFYVSDDDPDGTIAGIAGTPAGRIFRVAQGEGLEYSFIYYENQGGIARRITTQPSAAMVTKALHRGGLEAATSSKIPAKMSFSGELFNGATGWNGLNECPSPYYGGFSVPAGVTGYNSYVSPRVTFTPSMLADMAGNRVLFIFGIRHSAALGDAVSDPAQFVRYAWQDNEAISRPVMEVYSLSDTESVVIIEADINAASVNISVALQYKINSVAAEQLTFYTHSAFYRVLRTGNFAKELDNHAAARIVPPTNDLTPLLPSFIEMLNGAVRDVSTGKVTIPAGVTGYNTYTGRFNAIHNDRTRAGEVIRLEAVFTCSPGFLQTLSAYVIGVVKKLDGVQSTAAQIPGSEAIYVIDDSTFRISADYIVSGNASELVAVYFQLRDNTPTSSERSLTIKHTSYAFLSDGDFRGDIVRETNQKRLTTGSLLPDLLSVGGEAFNGGVLDKTQRKLTIPVGSTGNNTYLQPFMDGRALVKFPGARARISMLFETSGDVTAQSPVTANIRINTSAGQNNTAAEMTRVKPLNASMLRAELVITLTGQETTFAPYIQVKSNIARTTAALFKLTDLRVELLDVVGLNDTLNDQMLSFRLSALKTAIDKEISDAAGGVAYYKTITIKPDGSGDYTSLAAAIAANGGGFTALTQILYQLYSGIYPERNINFPAYITVDGIGNPWIKGELPADVDPAQIPLNQTIWINNTATIRNVKITCKNMRYPIHSDAQAYPDLSIKNAVLNLEGCHIEHYGNAEAQAYQDSVSSGVTIWSSCHAWGGGLHSGEKINCLNTDFISPTTAFYSHSNRDFDAPCRITIKGGSLRNRDPNGISALAVQNLGSGQVSFLNMEGVTIQGAISVDSNTWRAEKLDNQLADRNSEMRIYLHGCSPVAVRSTNDSRALQLISIDSASSSVVVSGTAVPALFGQNPVIIKGGSGYPARVLSAHSVKGEVAGGLIGQRLGDCTVVNKILTVIFDGGSPVTLTLAANYTAMPNDAVVSALNALLNDSSGRSFSIITPYNYSAPVYQSDRETILTNTSAAVILKGTAVAFNASKLNGRRANSGDIRSAIAGIALENIAPGAQGRVQSSGYIHATYVVFTGAAPAAFMATCSVNADATLSAGSSTPVLQRVGTDIYEII
ncbi:hypothetical protein HPO73_16315 [Klebsiella variicola]|uniref:hypothetical protein n=2 Tax=Klebsiella variicola TaxID=244366 RepID=UPI001660C1D6|nr:hypothetical protein [Klebsiella variicola]MBD0761279.1 hypothetical protein [Klebsiella variicola]